MQLIPPVPARASRRLFRLSAVAGLSLAALVGGGGAAGRAQGAAPPGGVPVQAVTTARRDVPVTLRNIGSVQAYQTVQVRARVDGTLTQVFFREGQDVKSGAPLAEIDPRPYAAALAQAQAKLAADEAQLANARLDLVRYSNLSRNDFASRQQVDTQQALVAQYEATLKGDAAAIATAQLNLDFCHITSPLDGRTGLRLVDAGNLIQASANQPIVSITQIHPIAVIFTLPQDDMPQIQQTAAHGAALVQAYAGDDRTLLAEGKLETMDNAIDQTTGTIRLKAVFANADDKLWPGQFVNVRMRVDMLHDALIVPSLAVQHGPDGLFVFVVKPDSTVALQPVAVQQDDGANAVIARGLDDGAEVVTHGQSRLQNGTRVTVGQPKTNS